MSILSSIKKYGSTSDCFAFELGRKSILGPGIIALQSKKYNSKIIYDHFNELTEQSFLNIREKILQDELKFENLPKVGAIREYDTASKANISNSSEMKWFTPSSSIGSGRTIIKNQFHYLKLLYAQSVDDEDIEHRKRKHRVGVDPSLAQWLWKDPKRVPKVREDIARWTNYMATEMSNPAFEIFINMASNLRNNRQHSPKTQDG